MIILINKIYKTNKRFGKNKHRSIILKTTKGQYKGALCLTCEKQKTNNTYPIVPVTKILPLQVIWCVDIYYQNYLRDKRCNTVKLTSGMLN